MTTRSNARSEDWQRRFRPLKDEYSRALYDDMIHVTLRIDPKVHDAMLVRLKIDDVNRSVWILKAIDEKLARDNEQQQS